VQYITEVQAVILWIDSPESLFILKSSPSTSVLFSNTSSGKLGIMGGETHLVDDSTGRRALVATTVLLALALLCFSARIYTRIFPSYKLNASDFMNAFAVVSSSSVQRNKERF
jgi:hypothetical protein